MSNQFFKSGTTHHFGIGLTEIVCHSKRQRLRSPLFPETLFHPHTIPVNLVELTFQDTFVDNLHLQFSKSSIFSEPENTYFSLNNIYTLFIDQIWVSVEYCSDICRESQFPSDKGDSTFNGSSVQLELSIVIVYVLVNASTIRFSRLR